MPQIHKYLSKDSISRSEKKLFDILLSLNNDWHIWMNANLRFALRNGASMEREVDCILYHRELGMLLVECKDGQISTEESLESEKGFIWKQNQREMERSPVDQVLNLVHPLHQHFCEMFPRQIQKDNSHQQFSYDSVRVQWALFFGDMENLKKIGSNAVQSKRVILKSDLKFPNLLLRKITKILETKEASFGNKPFPNTVLSEENLQKLVAFLGCFDEPTWPEIWDMQANARIYPTEIQEMLMESITRNPRMRIEGVAGSGKSLMAQWEVARLFKEGKRIAFLCYNDLLAEQMQNNFQKREFPASQVTAASFYKLAAKYVRLAKVPGAPRKEPQNDEGKKEYFAKMPHYFKQALDILRKQNKASRFFDALIIDEGQDFDNSLLDTILLLLKEPQKGFVRFFYDSHQTIYKGRPVLGNTKIESMPVIFLKRGFRSTKKILLWVREITGISVSCYETTPTGHDVDVRLYSDPQEQIALLYAEIARLKKKAVEPKDILVVSLRSRSNSALAELHNDEFQWSDVHDSLNSLAINIVSAYRYKGLDKRVVILTDLEPSANNPGEPHSNANLILVGATRAKEHLIVFKQRSKIV